MQFTAWLGNAFFFLRPRSSEKHSPLWFNVHIYGCQSGQQPLEKKYIDPNERHPRPRFLLGEARAAVVFFPLVPNARVLTVTPPLRTASGRETNVDWAKAE